VVMDGLGSLVEGMGDMTGVDLRRLRWATLNHKPQTLNPKP